MLLLSSSEIRCTAQDLEWCQIWESIQKTLHRLLLPHLPCKQNCGEVLLPGRLPAEQKECLALYSLAPFCPGLNMWHQSQINTYPLSKFHMSKFWSRSLIKWFKYLTPLKARGRKKASAGQTEFAVTVMKTEWGESKSSVKLGLLLLLRAGEEKADYCLCLFPAHVTSSRLWDKQHRQWCSGHFTSPPAPCCPVQLCPFPVHKAASMSHQFLRQQHAQAGYFWEAEDSLPCTMPLCFAFSIVLLYSPPFSFIFSFSGVSLDFMLFSFPFTMVPDLFLFLQLFCLFFPRIFLFSQKAWLKAHLGQ